MFFKAYSIQPSIQVASSTKQVLSPSPTSSTSYNNKLISASTTQTTHPNNGAISFSSFQKHLGHSQPSTNTPLSVASVLSPQYYTAATSLMPQILSQVYGKTFTYASPVAQASAPAIFTASPDDITYGSHMMQGNGLQRLNNYSVSSPKFPYPGH